MNKLFRYLLVALFMAAAATAAAQQPTVESLQEQIRRAEEEIRINTQLLEKNKKDQQVSQSQLKMIQERIRSRRKIVSSLEQQIGLLNKDISSKNKTVTSLQKQLDQLRAEYAEMVRAAYKNYKLNNFLLFLFASDDFNDATRRIDFMRRYNRMRAAKAAQIRGLSDSLSVQITQLDAQRAELDGTKKTHGQEITSLGSDEKQYASSVTKLKVQQDKISKDLKAKRDQIEKAQKQIQEIVAAEARKNQAEKRTEAEDKYITELSGRFDENKGKLPYPIRGGVIIDRWGTHQHPTQKGLIINNKGINIAGERGAQVLCVFEGTVSRVFSLPGYNNCVMVRHGNYITLYANMASVSVKAGEKVSLGQRVGRIADSTDPDDNFLHFEVWEQTNNLNPELWLKR